MAPGFNGDRGGGVPLSDNIDRIDSSGNIHRFALMASLEQQQLVDIYSHKNRSNIIWRICLISAKDYILVYIREDSIETVWWYYTPEDSGHWGRRAGMPIKMYSWVGLGEVRWYGSNITSCFQVIHTEEKIPAYLNKWPKKHAVDTDIRTRCETCYSMSRTDITWRSGVTLLRTWFSVPEFCYAIAICHTLKVARAS